jgi:flagellar biosynthesis GTPase FlhF
MGLRKQGQNVRLLTTDTRKVLARHELAAYAKLIGVDFQPGKILEKDPSRVVLQDTPSLGIGQSESFKEVERNCRDASVVVVLDASHRLEELLRTVDRFLPLAPVALAFTRLDTVSQAGVIYEVLKQTKLPLLGVSASQNFSSPFRFFEPTSLARYLLRKPFEARDTRALIETAANLGKESAL